MAATIFVRERRKTGKGEKKPRFRVVGVHDSNTKLYAGHLRKKELEQIAQITGAQLVFLDTETGKGDGGGR
ncbi:MAG: hypothetical protein WBG37_16630 [Desulfobacterales bacterium]|jgi:hypothetical protein